jgi:hypothetical protein
MNMKNVHGGPLDGSLLPERPDDDIIVVFKSTQHVNHHYIYNKRKERWEYVNAEAHSKPKLKGGL